MVPVPQVFIPLMSFSVAIQIPCPRAQDYVQLSSRVTQESSLIYFCKHFVIIVMFHKEYEYVSKDFLCVLLTFL